jgi:mycothiol synthase
MNTTNFMIRPARWDDLEAVAKLIYEVCEADGDATVAVSPDELKLEWQTPGFDLETDAFVAEAKDGRVVGFEEFNNRHAHAALETDGYVHPEFRGCGIGTALLQKIEARAHQEIPLAESDVRVFLRGSIDTRDQTSHDLYQNEGFKPIRYFWRMEIKLEAAPALASFPEGIELHPYRLGEQDYVVWSAAQEAFRDHWDHHEIPFEDWKQRKLGRENFDPTLWMIAWEGDEIAGFTLNRYRNGIGWIGTLGVRRPWRKRGLGEALLLHSFGEFYKRGMKTIGLGVDATNPTGATRLYKKVGMYTASEFLTFEKELRPGKELEVALRSKLMNIRTIEQQNVSLPEGFTTRSATLRDVEAAMALFNRWSRAVIGRDEFAEAESIRNEWLTPGANPAEDVRLIFAPNGELVGHIEVWKTAKPRVHPELWGRIDPRYEDLGIGTWMLHWAEQQALMTLPSLPTDVRFAPQVGVYRQAEKAKKLFEDMGYRHIRSNYHMLIEMDAQVLESEFPNGIVLRTYNPETDAEAAYLAEQDAFRDHFGFVEKTLEEGLWDWKHRREREGYDPTLYFLAMDGDEIAGFNFCRPYSFYDVERGWVRSLGVRRSWRKRGLGLALLRYSFNEFYRRGKRKVGLGVDAENLTGALRLYEGAGMHVDRAYEFYEKELRPGTEISVRSLS